MATWKGSPSRFILIHTARKASIGERCAMTRSIVRSKWFLLLLVLGACAGNTVGSTGSSDTTTSMDTTVPTEAPVTLTTLSAGASEFFDASDWIAYQGSGVDSVEAVLLIHPDGTERHEIDDDISGYGQLPDWSPDGTKVVMTPRGPIPELLRQYDISTETTTVLFECEPPCIGDDEPAYSPDGTELVFIRAFLPMTASGPSECGLWIGEVATGELAEITSNDGCAREYNPRWSPDGSRIAYSRERNDATGLSEAVFVMDAGGGEEAQLTEWEMVAGYPDWSPDGEWIVFVTYPFHSFNEGGPVSNLYRMRPDGTEVEQLTFYEKANPRPNQPRYTPDGHWIVFAVDTGLFREIWVMPAEGGEPMALITGGIHTHPAWQPTG